MMEREAVRQLFVEHYAKMLRVARTLLYDEQESEDVVGDVFERLLNREQVLKATTEEHYLLTSVRYQCLKRLRHARLKREVDFAEAPADEDERLADIVEFVVSHLSRQEQRIFNMRFTDGCTYEEIAAEEGISRVAVWKHLAHIITLIKQRFNPR
jgi:RNA polymerase sigma-70 factor (ECF subfamily)